jgi:hypothetical protein
MDLIFAMMLVGLTGSALMFVRARMMDTADDESGDGD